MSLATVFERLSEFWQNMIVIGTVVVLTTSATVYFTGFFNLPDRVKLVEAGLVVLAEENKSLRREAAEIMATHARRIQLLETINCTAATRARLGDPRTSECEAIALLRESSSFLAPE